MRRSTRSRRSSHPHRQSQLHIPQWASDAPTKKQSDALNAYSKAVSDFGSILAGGCADQFETTAAELAGTGTLSCTHQHDERIQDSRCLPSKIGRPINSEFLRRTLTPIKSAIDEYRALSISWRHTANARNQIHRSRRCRSGNRHCASKGLDTANAAAAGRIGLGLFFAETNGNQNVGRTLE